MSRTAKVIEGQYPDYNINEFKIEITPGDVAKNISSDISFTPHVVRETVDDDNNQWDYFVNNEKVENDTIVNVNEPNRYNVVKGTVIKSSNVSVNCEVVLNNGGVIEIDLPPSLFPEPISIGYPFELRMDESSGIRKPLIKRRVPDAVEMESGADEMARFIDEL
jgi:hypothetical protein